MAKISTYPIISIPTLNDLLIGTDVENLNETKNFTIGDIADLIIVGSYVPYVGATADVDLGIHSITASSFIVPGGLATQFVKADGSLDSTVYQPAGDYITGLSGEATALGPGVANVVLDNGAVIGKVLTGLTITGGSVSDTDTILQAFGKVQNQINSLVGGVQYQGTWNAATNTPTLQSGVGQKGYYYVVSVAGSTNLDGITDWNVGDWAIFDGTAWQQVDNTDTVVSVNGKVGVVVLTTTDIAEGTNLYYTDARVRQAISLTTTGNSGASTYDNLTGIFNIPNYTLAGLGGVPLTRELTINGTTYDLSANRSWSVGTITQIDTTGPLTGGPITVTGTIGITQSGASSDGYLSSVDWNTFNNKQNALTNPVTGTGTTYYLPMWTGLTSLGDSIISLGTGVVNFNYNNPSGATVNYTNIGTTAYTYSIVMNNVTRNTFHSYTDGNIIQRINSIDVSKNLSTGQLVLPLYTSLTSFPGTGIGYLGFDASGNILTVPAQSLAGYVPYVGATGNVNLGEFGLSTGFVTFDLTPTGTPATQGTMYWDDSRSTVALIMGGTIQHIGQDSYFYAKNSSGSSIPKGTAVRFAGTDGASGHILIVPFLANGTFPSSYFMGVTAETIANGGFGQVVNFGELEGIDTSAYTAGALLYASTTVAGGFQTTAPDAPNNIVLIAATLNSKNNGAIIVRPTLGSNINDDEGVLITSPAIGQVLKYNGALWVNDSDSGITGTGAPGQVAYFTGATTQAGSNNLFWDTANNRLGIGTNTPTAILDATINANAKLVFQNVSQNNLNVSGTNSTLVLNATGGSVFPSVIIQVAGTGYGQFQATTTETGIVSLSAVPITFKRGGTEQMRLTATGNLHIGTFASDSGQRLQVIGSARIGSTAATAMYWDDATSRLGISTSSPQGKLDVAGSLGAFRVLDSGAEVYFTRDGNNDFFANAGTSSGLSIGGRSYLRFSTGVGGVTEVARFNSVGSLGIGTTSFTGNNLAVIKNITGGTIAFNIQSAGVIQSDVTGYASYYRAVASTQATTFTLGTLAAFSSGVGSFGAGSTVSNYIGFHAQPMTTGINNYAFYGEVANGTGRWNLYMAGTADNYLAGNLSIGTTSTTDWLNIAASTTAKAHINLAAGVAPTTPVNGDIWMTSTDLVARINGVDYSLINSGISGSGAVGQVTYWSSASGLTGSNNLFWNNASSRLDITGSARIGTASAVAGATTIEQIYSGDNIIGSISARWGTGAMILGYGAKAKSGADGFVSTFDNFSARRAIFEISQGIFSWLNTASVNTAKGSDLTPGTLMTLDATGNLLLGLISDAFIQANRTVIAINGVTDTLMSFRVSNTSAGYIYATSTVFDINSQSRPLTFSTTGTEKGRFFNNGNFGIGTLAVDTGEKLQVVGNTYISSGLRIGPNALTTQSIRASRNITGGTIITSALFDAAVQSDVTADVTYINAATRTAAASFNVSSIVLFSASQTVIGAGSSVTNQHGFVAASSLIGATNNYGFVGAIPSGTGRWNLYMSGTADNYIAGSVGIGTTSLVSKLNVAGIGGTDGVTLTLMNGGSVLNQNDPLGIVDFYSNDISVGAAGSRGNIAVRNEYPGHWDGNPIRENTYIALSVASSRVVYERMRISSSGAIRFNSYGVGAFTGTVAYNLAVDASGNIIETAGGVVDGSGTTNYVSKWSDPNTLTNSLIFDNGTNVGINSTVPLAPLTVHNPIANESIVELRGGGGSSQSRLLFSYGNSTSQADQNAILIASSTEFGISALSTRSITFNTNSLERARVFGNGNFGIGTGATDTGEKLQVIGTAKITGNLAVDTSTLFVDAVNNRVGINTAAPSSTFVISGNGARGATATGASIRISNTTTSRASFLEYDDSQNFSFWNSNDGVTGGNFIWYNSTGSGTERMRLDNLGNLGLGVSPSAWRNVLKAFEIGLASLVGRPSVNQLFLNVNNYIDSSAVNIYTQNGFATRYYQADGTHVWQTAPSGTAGNAITFTQAMTLDASGNLLLGSATASADSERLQVSGNTLLTLLNQYTSLSAPTGVFIKSTTTSAVGVIGLSGNGFILQGRTAAFVAYPILLQPYGSNVVIGSTTDSGQRLQVTGTSIITGDATFNGTIIGTITSGLTASKILFTQTVANQNAGVAIPILTYQNVNAAQSATMYGIWNATNQSNFVFQHSQGTTGVSMTFNRPANQTISGNTMVLNQEVTPTSGTSTWTQLLINPTVNQTGGANGISRGLAINPTLTAAVDWRSIEWFNNTGWGLYGAGGAPNYLAGSLAIGTTTFNDNLNPYKAVVFYATSGSGGGGLMVTSNQAANGANAMVSAVQWGLNNGSVSKPSGLFFNYSNTTHGNRAVDTVGNLISKTLVGAVNLSITNNNGYIQHVDLNSTSNDYVNYQGYLYVQRNSGTVNVNSYTSFRSMYQTAVGSETITDIIDFRAAQPTLSTGALVTNRYGLLIDFNNTQVTNAWGIYQTSNTVKNYLNGNLLLGSIIDSGEKLQVNGTAKVTGISSFGGNMTLTTNTNYAFSIVNSGTGAASLNYSNASGAFYMGIDSVGGGAISGTTGYARLVWGQGAYPLLFATNNVERMRINESGSLGLGANTINASALFQMDSTSQGFLPPRMTATQRAAITTPAEGLIVYQTDSVIGLYIYANGTWRTLGMI